MVDQERLKEVKNATIRLFTPLWQSNFNRNKRDIARCPGVNTLKDRFRNIPCIIVGAGPSLDKNIKYLHAAKDRTLIVSCDAALKTLISNSIIPSLVVNLDPQEYVVDFFKDIDTKGLTLVASTVIHPSVLKMWYGRVIFYNKYAPDIPLFNQIQAAAKEVGTLTPGGSVLSVAYDLVFKIGANPITFIGQDLSYSNGNVYNREIMHKEENLLSIFEKQRENIVNETDIFGSDIPTIKSMSVTKQWLEWAFAQWKRDGELDVINSTEGGILKKGCHIMPLSEVIYRYCNKKINTNWMLNKILKYKV